MATNAKNVPAASAPAPIERNGKGQFLPGHIGVGGRKPGSRNALSGQLIDDVFKVWTESGIDCLRRLAAEDPGKFASLAVALVPKDIGVTIDHRVEVAVSALEAYRLLKATPATELRQIEHNEND